MNKTLDHCDVIQCRTPMTLKEKTGRCVSATGEYGVNPSSRWSRLELLLMKLPELTQEKLNDIVKQYHKIAFPKRRTDIYPTIKINDVAISPNGWFRFGMMGHYITYLHWDIVDGIITFSIDDGHDNLNEEQQKVITKLKEWASKL